jgi:predicted nucleotidyltransferase
MRRQNIVNQISTTMRKQFPQAVTILYGSEARGEARADSDIDLLILLPDELSRHDFNTMQDAVTDSLYSIELQHGVCISYIVRQPKIWHQHQTPFTVNVANEGIQL